jgi:hypothetical protein
MVAVRRDGAGDKNGGFREDDSINAVRGLIRQMADRARARDDADASRTYLKVVSPGKIPPEPMG